MTAPGSTGDFYDSLETRSQDEREAALFNALPAQLRLAQETASGWTEILKGVEPYRVTTPAALAKLPVTRKSDLMAHQKERPPLGGLAAIPPERMWHLFASPGPVYEFDRERADFWGTARAFFAAGFRAGDLVHNAFSYHLTPGAWIMESGMRALGCPVIPAGTGNSEQQVEAIAHLKPTGFCSTPDFLKVVLDKAEEMGRDASSLTKAMVSGGALFPALRHAYGARGVAVYQCYATADLGLIAYESPALDGMILNEGLILEIVQPGSGRPLPPGQVGEVVITNLNPDYPLIRFATGDLSAILPGASPCGRSNLRIKGWMGRADQTTKVKGMFVQPSQIAAVQAKHPDIIKARLVVSRRDDRDVMTLRCEVSSITDAALSETIAESLRDSCKLSGAVDLLAPGSLPNDGLVIEDQRDYD